MYKNYYIIAVYYKDMEQLLYERPREKIQYRGVKTLSLSELTQVIIGSGTAQVSGARLARKISRELEKGDVSYAKLTTLKGVGAARASQLLAAIELGRRLSSMAPVPPKDNEVWQLYLQQAQAGIGNGVTCFWFDGSRIFMDYKQYKQYATEHYSVLVKRILADALAASAHVILVYYPSKSIALQPSASEMGFVRQLYDTARYFQITVDEVCGINKKEWARWKKQVI